MKQILGVFMLAMAPMVPLKPYIMQSAEAAKKEAQENLRFGAALKPAGGPLPPAPPRPALAALDTSAGRQAGERREAIDEL